MHTWKSFVALTGAAGGGNSATCCATLARAGRSGSSSSGSRMVALQRQLARSSLRSMHSATNSSASERNDISTSRSGAGGSSGSKSKRSTTISPSRNQSTTQTKLAASHQVRKELASLPEDEGEEDEADRFDDDQLIYERKPAALSEAAVATLLGDASATAKNSRVGANIEAHRFAHRHIGPREQQISEMLGELGYKNLDELIEATIPEQIRLARDLRLPEAISEHQLLEELKELGSQNESSQWKSFIGMGYYDCVTPPAILRNIFENPGWSTAYTAYQAEIAQGRLEGLMNYQTMVSDLTGLDVANASLLDESTAAAEAMQVCLRHHKSKRNKFLVSTRCHPQTLAVVETRAKALGVEIDYFDELTVGKGEPMTKRISLANELSLEEPSSAADKLELSDYSGVLVQYPNTNGHLFNLDQITKPCHEAGCLVVVATDLMACTLFKPPGEFEHPADLAVGSSQRFGVPLNYGGPHAAFLACKQNLVRSIPGRVVGLTRDSNGNQAYRFALQTREQHIRRDKATSNICTAQALLANMSAMYAVYHGPEGLRQIASSIHHKTSLLAHLIKQKQQQVKKTKANGEKVKIVNDNTYFDTLTLRVNNQTELRQRANEAKINLRYANDDKTVCISLDETTKLSDIFRLANLFDLTPSLLSEAESGSGKNSQVVASNRTAEASMVDANSMVAPLNNHLASLKRETTFLTHPVFNSHRSEAQLVRYMKSLENKDVSLTHSMIPLGSCTMKLNATSQMVASSWPEFSNCHPFQPTGQCEGYKELFEQLDAYLCEVTGYDRISFQPNSGAQGEYAGLRVIRAYLESIGQQERNVCLIPISAHGTNPASAQMAGFRIQTIKVREDGNIDLNDLEKNIEKFKDQLACLMITYPSTFGVFEDSIREVCDMIHKAGGQVYLDGANMNAQVGLCRPGDYGSDVSHLNLHKTFCIPHGGGGPGAGPIGVKSHLIPFLPSHPFVESETGNNTSSSFGTVSASMWGSPAILPISWSYIRLMSKDLRLSSQVAILNANYMRKRLEQDYKILFTGAKGNVAHEFILDCRPFKKTANIEAVDIAKRLQDFGLHAPTVSWPVTNTLMLEPTESEDKQQLDRYCEALLAIKREIEAIESGQMDKLNNPIKNAPHTQQVVCSSNWDKPYSREQAAFPAKFVTPTSKIWPTVGRVDDTYGDTNLFCSCPPPERL